LFFGGDEYNQPQKLLLGMPKVSRYFGNIIAAVILDIINAYKTSDKIGYFTLDNAENNTIIVAIISKKLGFNGRRRRNWCIGHTINLAAKALLFGNNPDAFEEQFNGRSPMTTIEYQHWRIKGPVGKLHNLVDDVRNIHQLFIFFEKVQQQDRTQKKLFQLILDNDTRWLSQLYMIRRSLQLKTSIILLLIKARKEWNTSNWSLRIGKVPQSKLAKLPRYLQKENVKGHAGRGTRWFRVTNSLY
jgi:hypothetical protein